MAKRRTKNERIAQDKAALLQRIADIASGVFYGDDPLCEDFVMDVERFGEFLHAIKERVIGEETLEENTVIAGDFVLHHYTNVRKLTEFLYEYGVRA